MLIERNKYLNTRIFSAIRHSCNIYLSISYLTLSSRTEKSCSTMVFQFQFISLFFHNLDSNPNIILCYSKNHSIL